MNILYDERVDGTLPDVNKSALLQALQTRLPGLEVLHQQEELKPYECDGLSAYRTTPLLVILPRHLDEVQGVLRLCHDMHVPVVARGAGTGLSGGALPLEKGVLLVMARFNRILHIDPAARTARVCATSRFPRPPRHSACITRRTPPRKSPAPSAATSPKTPGACIASSTA
jgi:glycolate oxidase